MKVTEEWKQITDFPKYEVSQLGNIRSHVTGKPKVLKGGKNNCGYLRIRLFNADAGVNKRVFVHRVVAEYFIPNPEEKPCVNHINGDKADNRATNLEWVTYSENYKHALKTKLFTPSRGEKSGTNKLTADQVREIRKLYNEGFTNHTHLGKRFGVSRKCVTAIVYNKHWKHLL